MRKHSPLLEVVACLSTAMIGCGVGEVPEAMPQPNLVIVDESTAARLTVAPDRVSLAGVPGPLASVQVGDVIVSSGPVPFLRSIIAIDDQAGELAFVTEPAAMTDAIFHGHMHSNRDLLAEHPADNRASGDLVIGVDKLAFDFGGTTLIDDGDFAVSLDKGTISFRPFVDVELEIDDGSLSRFHTILRGDLTASMGVTISSNRTFSRSFSKTLWESPAYTATQFIGVVPVVEVVRVSLVLSGEVHAGASGTVDLGAVTATGSVEAGASYEDGRWRVIADPSVDFEAHGPAFQTAGNAGTSLRLTTRIDVKLYDIAGPHVTVGSYARAELTDSIADGLVWSGRVGMDGTFGGDVSALGKTASYDRQLFDVGHDFAMNP